MFKILGAKNCRKNLHKHPSPPFQIRGGPGSFSNAEISLASSFTPVIGQWSSRRLLDKFKGSHNYGVQVCYLLDTTFFWYPDTWISWILIFFGYLDKWILGYHGYMDTWILGYMDISFLWIHGYLDTLDINFFHYPYFGYPIQVSGYFWILF